LLTLQLFFKHGDGEQVGECVQAVAHDGFQKGFGLDVVAFQDVPVKDRPIIGLKEFAFFQDCFLLDDFRKSALFQILFEGLQDPPSGRRQQGPLVVGDAVKAEEFREGKGHHEDVSAPAAQFRRNFAFQEAGIAARDDDAVAVLIVEGPQDAAPAGQLLNFVEKEKGRRFSGDLLEGGEQSVRVGGGEIRKAVVFEIDKQDIFPAPVSLRQEILDQLIHIAGFPCPSRTGHGDDFRRPLQDQIRHVPFYQRREDLVSKPFCYDFLDDFGIHHLLSIEVNNFYHYCPLKSRKMGGQVLTF